MTPEIDADHSLPGLFSFIMRATGSVRTVSEASGIPTAMLNEFLCGDRAISIDNLIVLARACRHVIKARVIFFELEEQRLRREKKAEMLRRCSVAKLRGLEKARKISMQNRHRRKLERLERIQAASSAADPEAEQLVAT